MTCKQNTNCSTGKFKRLNYYHGMLMTEQDFQEEQTYFREKMKLHNRMHGYGVVWGLGLVVKCTKIDGQQVQRIFIEPGFALDCEGNEIIVCNSYLVSLDDKIAQLNSRCEPLKPCTKLLIAIRYCECKSAPQPQYASDCGDEEPQAQFSRITEGFSVEVLLENELPDCCNHKKQNDCCTKHKQDCPGLATCCEEDHVIILGCLCLDSQDSKDRGKPQPGVEDGAAVGNNGADGRKDDTDRSSINIANITVSIDPCCKAPRICKPCPTPQEQWEQQKQRLLHQAKEALGGIDFCGVIGKSVCDAEVYLKEIGLKPVTETKPFNERNKKQLLRLIEKADCIAAGGQSIILITDEQQHCVLFAYVQAND
jgi:hypothetical protein